jgi:outer membrane protein OmpA-like peptidoglycan-associated protein
MRYFSLLAVVLIFSSCGLGRFNELPEIPEDLPEVKDFPNEGIHTADSVDGRFRDEHLEVDLQIKDESGQIYKVKKLNTIFSDIEVYENGTWRPLTKDEYSLKGTSIKQCKPKDYCILIDHSGSMTKRIQSIYREVEQFIDHKNDFDHVALINYTTEVKIACEFIANKRKLVNELFDPKNSLPGGGDNAGLAYETFMQELMDKHPNDELEVIIFSDMSGMRDEKLDRLIPKAYADSIETHRLIYFENIRGSLITKKGKERVLKTYDYKYGKSYVVDRLGGISACLNNIIDEDCMTTTVELPIYQSGLNQYRLVTSLGANNDTTLVKYSHHVDTVVLELSKFEVDTVNILHIEFASGSDQISDESLSEVKRLVDFLETYPDIRIEVQGHTDNQGSYDYNIGLSHKRAQAVMNALVNSGIKTYRIEANGYGYTKPVESNDTPEGRRRNRRTEFVILRE